MIGIYDLEDKSQLNFGNRFDLADNSYEVNFRPDFRLSNDRLFFSIKPRAEFARVKVSLADGSQETENEDEYFLQEWLTRAYLTDTMSISMEGETCNGGLHCFCLPQTLFWKSMDATAPIRKSAAWIMGDSSGSPMIAGPLR